jgi:hypothetical protein
MLDQPDELLHRDSAGDCLFAAPPRGKHGTLLYVSDEQRTAGQEWSVYVPTAAVDVFRTALAAADADPVPPADGEAGAGQAAGDGARWQLSLADEEMDAVMLALHYFIDNSTPADIGFADAEAVYRRTCALTDAAVPTGATVR